MRSLSLFTVILLLASVVACATPATPAAPVATPTTPAPPVATPTTPAPPVPASTPAGPTGDLTISFHQTGGVAGVNQTYTLKPDGSVDTGKGVKQADGGAAAAATLASKIAATGIYAVTPGKYMPASQCCDRFTYDVSLTVGGKAFTYTTMDGAENAPPALLQTIGLIGQYVASAR